MLHARVWDSVGPTQRPPLQPELRCYSKSGRAVCNPLELFTAPRDVARANVSPAGTLCVCGSVKVSKHHGDGHAEHADTEVSESSLSPCSSLLLLMKDVSECGACWKNHVMCVLCCVPQLVGSRCLNLERHLKSRFALENPEQPQRPGLTIQDGGTDVGSHVL